MAGPFERQEEKTVCPRARRRRLYAFLAPLVLAPALLAGCGFVPRKKLDECHQVSVTLRAENTRLKDATLALRAENQDLTQRAMDDSRKITAQEQAVERLEKSVMAYQAERDKLAAAFETIKRQVRLSASPQPQPTAELGTRLESFAAAHPGWAFDGRDTILSVPADRLFEPGKSQLKDGAGDDLKALAVALKGNIPDSQALEVVGRDGPGATSDVHKTGFDEAQGSASPGRFLATARAARIRETLVTSTQLDPGRIHLVPPPEADAASPASSARLELRVVPCAAGLDANAPGDK